MTIVLRVPPVLPLAEGCSNTPANTRMAEAEARQIVLEQIGLLGLLALHSFLLHGGRQCFFLVKPVHVNC